MSDKHKMMAEESVAKLLIKFSVPAIVGMLVNATYNVVDRIYIGNIKDVGHIAISGIGIILPIMVLVFAFALLIGLGSAANISLNLGMKNFKKAEEFLGNSITLSFIISITLFVTVNLFHEKIILLLGGSSENIFYAREYLSIINFGYLPLIIGYVANCSIRSDGSPKTAMLTLLIGSTVNIVLDPILIFYFEMGVAGAAYATIAAQTCSALWAVYYFLSENSNLKIKVKYFKLKLKNVISILKLGSAPFAIQLGISLVGYIMNTYLKKYGGDLSIGSYAIVHSVFLFCLMPVVGINQGVQPILGYNYGARLYKRVRETLFKAVSAATIICLCGFLSIQFFSYYIIRVFTKEPKLIALVSQGLKIQSLMMPLIGFQIVSSIYFQSVGKPKLSLFMSLSRQVLILIPCIIILSSYFGLAGIWYAVPLSDFIAFLVTAFFIKNELTNLSLLEKNELIENNK